MTEVAILYSDAVLATYDRMVGLLGQYLAVWGSGTAASAATRRFAVIGLDGVTDGWLSPAGC